MNTRIGIIKDDGNKLNVSSFYELALESSADFNATSEMKSYEVVSLSLEYLIDFFSHQQSRGALES